MTPEYNYRFLCKRIFGQLGSKHVKTLRITKWSFMLPEEFKHVTGFITYFRVLYWSPWFLYAWHECPNYVTKFVVCYRRTAAIYFAQTSIPLPLCNKQAAIWSSRRRTEIHKVEYCCEIYPLDHVHLSFIWSNGSYSTVFLSAGKEYCNASLSPC